MILLCALIGLLDGVAIPLIALVTPAIREQWGLCATATLLMRFADRRPRPGR